MIGLYFEYNQLYILKKKNFMLLEFLVSELIARVAGCYGFICKYSAPAGIYA